MLIKYTYILLMIEKGIRGEICQAIHRYRKADNKWKIAMQIENHVSLSIEI